MTISGIPFSGFAGTGTDALLEALPPAAKTGSGIIDTIIIRVISMTGNL